MRVLASVTGSTSHAHEMLPLVDALQRAGHTVLVATVPGLVDEFTGSGIAATAALPDQRGLWTNLLHEEGLGDTVDPTPEQQITILAGAPLIERSYRGLRSVAAEFAPDLLLRDGMEFTACLLGEHLGTPHVPVPSGASNVLDPAAVAVELNERRRALGLPIPDDPLALYRHGRIDSVPARYSLAMHGLPSATSYQQPESVRPGASLPAWVGDLDPAVPLVYASIGLALAGWIERRDASGMIRPADPLPALRAMISALSELDCQAVVATGGLPVDDVERADHVHVVDRAPQQLLLPCAQLFVTHGGYNGIREAMRAGVPMVVMPLFGDQHDNARRVESLGLGERVADRRSAELLTACRAVLSDSSYTARVRHAQRELLALPCVDEIVPRLESIVASAGSIGAGV
ncbi:glycosyltransferase [Saccharopolyspora sp. NPDC002578]